MNVKKIQKTIVLVTKDAIRVFWKSIQAIALKAADDFNARGVIMSSKAKQGESFRLHIKTANVVRFEFKARLTNGFGKFHFAERL